MCEADNQTASEQPLVKGKQTQRINATHPVPPRRQSHRHPGSGGPTAEVMQSHCLQLVTSLEKAMAPHSRTLAWKIPWTEEPSRLQSMGLRRVGHD